jgi:hypothetical protein
MKKIIFIACFLIVISCLCVLFLKGSELGNKNLKGIKYIITAVGFNGVTYGEGYVDEKEEAFKEFNLKEAAAKLEEDGIPVAKEAIRKLYTQINSRAGEAGLTVVKAKTYSDEKVTLIPTLTAGIDIMKTGKAGGETYFAVVHLTLTKWMSNWVGTTRILAPVYAWSAKKMAAAGSEDVTGVVEAAISELMEEFLDGVEEVNPKEKSAEEKKS